MNRRAHFRPRHVSRLTRESPYTDESVAELIAAILGNRYAAVDSGEITKLCRSWNMRHDRLFAEQEARERDPSPESRGIATFNRHAGAARRTLHRIKQRRERDLETARSSQPDRLFFARLRLQEITAVIDRAEQLYLSQSIITPDWLSGFLDEIEAALRVTNPNKKFGRSKESIVVLIAEAAVESITGWEITADAISQQAVRISKKP